MRHSVTLCTRARDEYWHTYTTKQQQENKPIVRQKPLVAASCGCYGATLHDGSEYTGSYAKAMQGNTSIMKQYHLQKTLELMNMMKQQSKAEEQQQYQAPDVIIYETIPALLEVQSIVEALVELRQLFLKQQQEANSSLKLPSIIISLCCKTGTTVSSGDSIVDCVTVILDAIKNALQSSSSLPLLVQAIGVNCTKPHVAEQVVQNVYKPMIDKFNNSTLNNQQSLLRICCYPNSGEDWSVDKLWQNSKDDIVNDEADDDGDGETNAGDNNSGDHEKLEASLSTASTSGGNHHYHGTVKPKSKFARFVHERYMQNGHATIVGGCCRIGVNHIHALREYLEEATQSPSSS